MFFDVPPAHWASPAVSEMARKGIMIGYPDGSFKGDQALTRYEAAALSRSLYNKLSQKIAAANAPDVYINIYIDSLNIESPPRRLNVSA